MSEDIIESSTCSASYIAHAEFKDAARALKAAEQAYKAAQIAYADAVRKMSDLAVAEDEE